jgi:membrane associated rhomboid family serine protease
MPIAIRSVLLAIVLGFLLQLAFDPDFTQVFQLSIDPEAPFDLTAPWQLVTYSFVHDDWLHIGLNLLFLWIFGVPVEREWGARRTLFAYFAAVLTGALAQIMGVAAGVEAGGPVIGASGGVFGVMFCFGMLFPQRRLIPGPIQIRARPFVFACVAIDLLLGVTGTSQGIAYLSHLGGVFGGWLVYQYGA